MLSVVGMSAAMANPEAKTQCPYDKTHMVRNARMQYHLVQCRKVLSRICVLSLSMLCCKLIYRPTYNGNFKSTSSCLIPLIVGTVIAE